MALEGLLRYAVPEVKSENKPVTERPIVTLSMFPLSCGVNIISGLYGLGMWKSEDQKKVLAAKLVKYITEHDAYGTGAHSYCKLVLAMVTDGHQCNDPICPWEGSSTDKKEAAVLQEAGFVPIARAMRGHSGDKTNTLWGYWKQPPFVRGEMASGLNDPQSNPITLLGGK